MATPFFSLAHTRGALRHNTNNGIKYWGAIKYKTVKPVAHAQRAPQVLDLVFN